MASTTSESQGRDRIDLELMVRVAHRHYLNAYHIKGSSTKADALLSLTMAAEMYRKYGPSCSREEWAARYGHGQRS